MVSYLEAVLALDYLLQFIQQVVLYLRNLPAVQTNEVMVTVALVVGKLITAAPIVKIDLVEYVELHE